MIEFGLNKRLLTLSQRHQLDPVVGAEHINTAVCGSSELFNRKKKRENLSDLKDISISVSTGAYILSANIFGFNRNDEIYSNGKLQVYKYS